jgi:squalene cyclase
MPLTPTSRSGRKARAPKAWGRTVELLPKIRLAFLGPKTWTPELARKWVGAIPAKCPFERQLWWGDTLVLYVPPLCALNPLSKQLYDIRLEAQTYLATLQSGRSQFKD